MHHGKTETGKVDKPYLCFISL